MVLVSATVSTVITKKIIEKNGSKVGYTDFVSAEKNNSLEKVKDFNLK